MIAQLTQLADALTVPAVEESDRDQDHAHAKRGQDLVAALHAEEFHEEYLGGAQHQNAASGLLRCRGNCLSRCGRFLAQKHLFSNIFNREFQLLPIHRFGDVMGETSRNTALNVLFHSVTT